MFPTSPNNMAKRRFSHGYTPVPPSPRVKRRRTLPERYPAFEEENMAIPARSSVHELTSLIQGQQLQSCGASRTLVYHDKVERSRSRLPFVPMLQNGLLFGADPLSTISNILTPNGNASEEVTRLNALPQLNHPDDIVRLEIGGAIFKTRRGTFTSITGTHLAKLFSGPTTSAFIDRDAKHFDVILRWLRDRRTSSLWPMSDPTFVDDVRFYGLTTEMLGDGCIVIVGGEDDDGPFDTVEKFCPMLRQWTDLPALPAKRDAHACAVTVNGDLFMCGGYDDEGKKCASLYRLESNSCSWVALPSMRSARCRHQLVAANGVLFALGGLSQKGNANTPDSCFMEEFDISTLTWKDTPSPSQLRYGFGSVVLEGKIYVIGGLRPNGQRTTTVECYDIATGVWECVQPITTPRAYLSCAVLENKIYAIGGNNDQNQPSRHVEIYDPTTNTWSAGPSSTHNRCDAGCVSLNGLLYLFGGEDDEEYLSKVEIYDPALRAWQPGVSMELPKSSFAACVVPY
eukprot:m.79263 g.79263  ORF g.79263 m.79263 type:complete len:513 (+) comp25197_c0_seq1:345-1883(+)